MNFKNYFLLGLLLCGISACSSDDSAGPEEPVLQKAKFAVSVKNDQVAKRTKAGNTDYDKTVNKLTVGIFGDSWSTIYTQTPTTSVDGQFSQIGPQEVYAGDVQVVVVANASTKVEAALKSAKTMEEFIATPITLSDEYSENGLTMSSQVFDDIKIIADKTNYFGYAESKGDLPSVDGQTDGVEIKGDGAVKLVRNVASVSLKSINLSSEGNYNSKSFLLKEVFVANVKGLSQAASREEWGKIETPFTITADNDYLKYWVGEMFEGTMDMGTYKYGTQTESENLKKEETENCLLTDSWNIIPASIDYTFYVYDNVNGETNSTGKNYTLFVVRGDYTYTSKGGGDITDKDRFYAVIVNNPADMNASNYEGVGKHNYVKRNCKYEINLTILGPGSEVPYDPMISTNLSTAVKVEPWNVKNVHEEVE